MNIKMTEPNIQHTGRTVSVAEADRQSDAVKKIMADQKLDYGPAYDVLIKRGGVDGLGPIIDPRTGVAVK